jgi:hypothetical protein
VIVLWKNNNNKPSKLSNRVLENQTREVVETRKANRARIVQEMQRNKFSISNPSKVDKEKAHVMKSSKMS